VVQPAHVDDETASGSRDLKGAGASSVAGDGALPAVVVCADDAQPNELTLKHRDLQNSHT